MPRTLSAMSEGSPPQPGRESTFARRGSYRGRGRARTRYSKNTDYSMQSQRAYRNSYSTEDQRSDHDSREQYQPDSGEMHSHKGPGDRKLEDRITSDDLYDDRPAQRAGVGEGRPLEERITLPGDSYRKFEKKETGPEIDQTSDSQRVGVSPANSQDMSAEGDGQDNGATAKDPEELRQRVLHSLAEKKKAAKFLSVDEAANHGPSNDSLSLTENARLGSDNVDNPERDAAVEALLATYGTKDISDHRFDKQDHDTSRKYSDERAGVPHDQQKIFEGYQSSANVPPEPGLDLDRSPQRKEYTQRSDNERYKDKSGASFRSNQPLARREGGPEYHDGEYEGERKTLPRPDPRFRYECNEEASYEPVESKRRGKAIMSERKLVEPRYHHEEERTRHQHEEYYHSHEAPTKDNYQTVKSGRYLEPGAQELEYNTAAHEYPQYTPTRYVTALDKHPYSSGPAPRTPDADYTALYYRDLTEWLEITGYHDYGYRQMLLQRHRETHVLEGNRRYTMPDEPGHIPRGQPLVPREEGQGRGAMYSMPPPPPPVANWSERESMKRGVSSLRGSQHEAAYPSTSNATERRVHRSEDISPERGSLKRRISLRDDDYRGRQRLAKSARHGYDAYRKGPADPTNSTRSQEEVMNDSPDTEPMDETEAVRLSLSRRIAADRERRRSLSPGADHREETRDKHIRGVRGQDEPFYRDREHVGKGRAAGKEPPQDYRNAFHPRHDYLGKESSSPADRKSYGRGRGRGYDKDPAPYDSHYTRRDNQQSAVSERTLSEMRDPSIRYFIIKSYNEENVKMAQQDNIWATQRKNADMLEKAFREARDVILFFSINKSGKFQGYARMEGLPGSAPSPSWVKDLLWESSGPFKIKWISITDILFHRVAHLKNRFNESQPVLIGRDGQEIDPECGAALCKTMNEAAAFRRIHSPHEDGVPGR